MRRINNVPEKIDEKRSANYRWLGKPVMESVLIDDMEDLTHWQHIGVGEMVITDEKYFSGSKSLRLTSKTKMKTNITPRDLDRYGRPFGEAVCRRIINNEDWSEYNRLSFWVYPHLPGFNVISMCVVLHNDGNIKIPDSYQREGLHYFLLEPDRWNNVVWEIASLPRDRVTAVDIIYRMQGNEPGATDTVCFYIDKLELQKVEADYFEGWEVAPDRIAFSHTGYQLGTEKTAIGTNIDADEFSVINADNGQVALSKPIKIIESQLGKFQIMDFTELDEEGNYYIRCGHIETPVFRIDRNVWRGTVWKTLNFFFAERCGFEVSGIHGICHRDWQCEHNGQTIIINGGWHDAGDLSQGVWNTAEAVYAMFHLAETIKVKDPELCEGLVEEARWGLDWVLKTRFGDGYRSVWATMDFWTDGIIGTFDDIVFKAKNVPMANFDTAATEAIAARVLKDRDPNLAEWCRIAAEEDFRFALDALKNKNLQSQYRSFPEVILCSYGILSAIELYRITGKEEYARKAFEFARIITDCQQKTYTDWDIPLRGFFFNSSDKKDILHFFHVSHSQAPIVALVELIKEFRDHSDWMDWYSTILLFSEYLETIIDYTEPYYMFPASIYRTDESDQPTFEDQVRNGIRLSDKYYLRRFPVWFAFRGNNSLILSDAKAMASIARLRRRPELMKISQHQVEWVLGRNPFCQSLMYGEGYDYAPQYTAMSGNIAGSLPVGIQTSREKDIPYWPVNNCYNYKEVWVQPSARWLWLMSDISGESCIKVKFKNFDDFVLLTNEITQKKILLKPVEEGLDFCSYLPQGRYRVEYKGISKTITILPNEDFLLDLDSFCSFTCNRTISGENIVISIKADALKPVDIEIRTYNLELEDYRFKVPKTEGRPFVINVKGIIRNPEEKWFALIIPEGRFDDIYEIY